MGVAWGAGVGTGVGTGVRLGVPPVGTGVGVAWGTGVGYGVAAGSGVFVSPGVEVEVGKTAATFASTVASTALSASRVPRMPASTVAGTSGVGWDAVCVSAGDGASLVQATAVRPEITKTIRMIILIFFPLCREDFQSALFQRVAFSCIREVGATDSRRLLLLETMVTLSLFRDIRPVIFTVIRPL